MTSGCLGDECGMLQISYEMHVDFMKIMQKLHVILNRKTCPKLFVALVKFAEMTPDYIILS